MASSAKEISDLSHGVDVNASGNVGIGTDSPQVKLQVNDTGTAVPTSGYGTGFNVSRADGLIGMTMGFQSTNNTMYIQARNFTNTDSQPLLLNPTAGNIGIGVASPGAKLSVSGPAAIANLGGGSTASSAFYVNSTSGHVGELIQVLKNGTTKMHMANDGKLGLGTSGPQQLLHVYNASSGVVARIEGPNAYDSESGLEFSVGRARISGVLNGSGGTPGASLKFMTMPNGGSIAERMRIDSYGNVIVGVTSNSYDKAKLTVHGNPGNPATTGTSTANVGFRLGTTSGNSQAMDMGIYNSAPYGSWVQASNSGGLNNPSPISLNPNGGNIGIGTSNPLTIIMAEETGGDLTSGNAIKSSTMKGLSLNAQVGAAHRNSLGVWFGSNASHWSGIAGGRSNLSTWGTDLRFYTHEDNTADLTYSRQRMVINSEGNVGIGTTSPGAKLQVWGGGEANLYLRSDSFRSGIFVMKPGTTSTMGSVLVLQSDESYRLGTAGHYHIIMNQNGTTQLLGAGNVGLGVDTVGKVGIGTTSPADQLEVMRTSTDQTAGLTITNLQAGGYGSGIVWKSKRADNSALVEAAEIRVTGENNWNGTGNVASQMQFATQKDGTLTQHMTINKNGYVGIGITAPDSPLHVNGGRLHHTDTANSSHYGAANTVYPITDVSIIGGKLRFSIKVFFGNGISNLAVRIYVAQTSLWFAGEVCIGSTYSSQQATGLNRYSFSHNYNTSNNYGNIINQTESFGQVPAQFQFASHGYDTTENAHYFEFRHTASTGNTMFLQFEGMGSTPDHANLATWYYKHKTY